MTFKQGTQTFLSYFQTSYKSLHFPLKCAPHAVNKTQWIGGVRRGTRQRPPSWRYMTALQRKLQEKWQAGLLCLWTKFIALKEGDKRAGGGGFPLQLGHIMECQTRWPKPNKHTRENKHCLLDEISQQQQKTGVQSHLWTKWFKQKKKKNAPHYSTKQVTNSLQ